MVRTSVQYDLEIHPMQTSSSTRYPHLFLVVVGVFFSSNIYAKANIIQETANQYGDHIFSLAKVYQDDKTSVALSGRLQGDSVSVNSSDGDFDDTTWRRLRFGMKAKINHDITVHVEGDFNLNENAEYQRLTDAYVAWNINDKQKIKVLKQGVGFTVDGATSSKKLLTLERNNLSNNLWFSAEYFTGISVEGTNNKQIKYKAGIYANDGNDELSQFDASYFTLLSLTFQDDNPNFWQHSEYHVDYVYNEKDALANTRDFEHIVSVSGKFNRANWHLVSELAAGKGFDEQDNVWGLVIMPYYQLTPNWQLVGRYTMIKGNGDNSVRLGRYESRAVSGRGDQYHELYSGVNYYLNGHKLKLQLGAKYTGMADHADDGGKFTGWSINSGLRLYW
jgi:phosphate-selective porin OprO/OprP